jgi:hypothetical protein
MPKKVDRNKKNHRTKEDSLALPYETARAYSATGDEANPLGGYTGTPGTEKARQNRAEAERRGGGATNQVDANRNAGNATNRAEANRNIGNATNRAEANRNIGNATNEADASRRNGDTSNEADASRRNGDTSNQGDTCCENGDTPNQGEAYRNSGDPSNRSEENRSERSNLGQAQNISLPPHRSPQGDIHLPGFGTTFPIDERPQPGIPDGKTYLNVKNTDAEAPVEDAGMPL